MREFLYWNLRRPMQQLRLKFVFALPRWLIYWAAIRLISHATTGMYGAQSVPDLKAMNALDRWSKRA